jgi:hypothetical protein
MTLPFTIPDWLPWWVPVVVLIPALLYALAFLFMPFGVIGVKGRLEAIEARLDEIQGEIRSLVLRLPEPLRGVDYEDLPPYVGPSRAARAEPAPSRPPIPPAPHYPNVEPASQQSASRPARAAAGVGEPATRRAEPRLDWPR